MAGSAAAVRTSFTCWRRLEAWQAPGLCEKIWRTFLTYLDAEGNLEWTQAFLDGTFVPAKRGCGRRLDPQGQEAKVMLVTDGNGVSLGLKIASAQRAEIKPAELTLETVRVPHPGGCSRPKYRPRVLVADRDYDSWVLRENLRARGIRPCIPERKGKKPRPGRKPDLQDYRHRWHIKRTFAWFGNYRRFLVRHEYYEHVFEAFLLLLCILICVNRLLQ